MDKRVCISVIGVACLLGSDICAMNEKAALAKLKSVSLSEDCVRQMMEKDKKINQAELLKQIHWRTDDTSSVEVSEDVIKASADFSVYATQDALAASAGTVRDSLNETDLNLLELLASNTASGEVAEADIGIDPKGLFETLKKAIDQK